MIKQQTNIIASLHVDSLESAVEVAKNPYVSALRLIYKAGSLARVSEFLPRWRSMRPEGYLPQPVLLDVGSVPRGKLVKPTVVRELMYGETLFISPPDAGGDIELSSPDWQNLFAQGAFVYLDFGMAILRCLEVGSRVKVEVVQGGVIRPDCEVHVPATQKQPRLLELSDEDLDEVCALGVDYLVLPGLLEVAELRRLRERLSPEKSPWLIVRIDRKEVLARIADLLAEVDGVLVSRRELAFTVDPAAVPMLCKEAMRACNEQAKIVLIASELLGSMQTNPTPTRAEVSDVANAVIDGTDAVVLAEDLSGGRAFKTCSDIIGDVEEHTDVQINWEREALSLHDVFDTVAYQAYRTAERVRAKAIVCITKKGSTALRLASFRAPIPIIAVTFVEAVRSKLCLVRGVYPLLLGKNLQLDEVLPLVNERLKVGSFLQQGDCIVFVAVSLSPLGREASNLFTIQQVN